MGGWEIAMGVIGIGISYKVYVCMYLGESSKWLEIYE